MKTFNVQMNKRFKDLYGRMNTSEVLQDNIFENYCFVTFYTTDAGFLAN